MRIARARTARARAAGRGPSTHTDDKPHEHTAHTARAHRRAQRQAHRCGVGRPTPMPAFTGCCGPPPPAHLRHLGAVCVALAGSLALAKCAKGAAGNADTLHLEAAAHGHTSSTNGPSTRAQAAGARAGRFTAPGARTARHALQRQRLNSPRAHTHSASVPKYAPPAPRYAHSRHHHPHIRHGQRARPTRTWSSMRGSGAALAQHRGRLWNVVG